MCLWRTLWNTRGRCVDVRLWLQLITDELWPDFPTHLVSLRQAAELKVIFDDLWDQEPIDEPDYHLLALGCLDRSHWRLRSDGSSQHATYVASRPCEAWSLLRRQKQAYEAQCTQRRNVFDECARDLFQLVTFTEDFAASVQRLSVSQRDLIVALSQQDNAIAVSPQPDADDWASMQDDDAVGAINVDDDSINVTDDHAIGAGAVDNDA